MGHKIPDVLVNNGNKKQGRSVFCFFLLLFFALFLGGKAWADDPLVDGGVYLIKNKRWNNYSLYPKSGYMQVEKCLETNHYWCATKVEKDGETFYTFRNYDVTAFGVGSNSSSPGMYLVNLPLPNNLNEKIIKHGNFSPNNDSFLFKVVPSNDGSYAVVPYNCQSSNYSWFLNGTDKTLGVKDYTSASGNTLNQCLWDFVQVEAAFDLTDLSISGQMHISEPNTYVYTRGTSQCFFYLGSYMYSLIEDDNSSTNYTTYDMDYEYDGTLPSGITCTSSNDNWTIEVTTLPAPGLTITLKCTVTRHLTNGTEIQKVFRYPIVFIGQPQSISSLSQIVNPNGYYILEGNIEDASGHNTIQNFTGFFDGQHHTIKGLDAPIFGTMTNAVVRNVNLKDVAIGGTRDTDNTGSIANVVNGASRIYNVGILSGSVGGSGNTGGLVGLLDGTARVINCFSFADITSGGGQADTYVGGLVGNNNQVSTQTDLRTIVVNCMFYGDIDVNNCSNFAPVYGNNAIKNDNGDGINPYDFFRESASFDNSYLTGNTDVDIVKYNRSWPVLEDYLTRYEYYRSILNSNRRLMAWWVSGNIADTALISKWVLDPSIAPYPILKKWGKYPCITNPDTDRVWDTATGSWVLRTNALPYQGRILSEMGYPGHPGKLKVTVKAGSHNSEADDIILYLPITDMDTLHHDYGYAKVKLPYYNEQFGDVTSTDHATRYGNNYTDKVVTGWKITNITTDGTITDYHSFNPNWESGYNFADRHCIDKDLYATAGAKRVFAQGGFYYVPEGVTAITIEAYWGKAVYLHNTGHYLDRVDITNHDPSDNPQPGLPFVPAGKVPETFQNQTVYQSWQSAVLALDQATNTNNVLNISVYDQAIVLLNNFQWRNENHRVGTNIGGGSNRWFPYTIMSIDKDLDNEPDYCFELQFRRLWGRPGIQPIRFDFLPVPELGMAVRHGVNQNTIGIFVPLGHFEITETSYMHTTQFEYDAAKFGSGPTNGQAGTKVPAPVILNGGHFEQIVVRYGPQNNTQYFIMGGHFRMLRFTPGAHTNPGQSAKVRLCAVNVIGGEFPEFYLSGIYRPKIEPESIDKQGNPHCYINGGKFDLICGAGYDKILGSVCFKIDHAIIGEFYGGGINGSNPIGGSIDVTINNSLVEKYCGGPKVGQNIGSTVTTHATGTIFGRYYGGGNGGTSYYREQKEDGNIDFTNPSTLSYWNGHGYNVFNPLNTISGLTAQYDNSDENKGYHALFEFECFVESNGLGENPTIRSYLHWAQFGTTKTGDVTNVLTDCTVKKDFYGGGNLANVNGDVTSTLTDCTILGNVFGGGYSGKIEPFRIHNKNAAHFPYIDGAGVMQDGMNRLNSLDYIDREYTWCYKNATTGEMFPQGVVIPNYASTSTNLKATFEYPTGSNKWYVLTKESLEHLGAVSGNVTLTINGRSNIGTLENGMLKNGTGNVYGGGNESTVDGSTLVKVFERTKVFGNIYGGGNMGLVGGDAKVIINGKYTGTGTGTNIGGN